MYHIYASLEDQKPTLKIVDAESRRVLVNWQYSQKNRAVDGKKGKAKESDRKEIQRLFKELILLTCQQQAGNSRIFACLDDASDEELTADQLTTMFM